MSSEFIGLASLMHGMLCVHSVCNKLLWAVYVQYDCHAP